MRTQIYTVLIVDDNEVNRKILFHILHREYNILQAENGKQALDILKRCEKNVSAVLLDLVMPVMDGYAFLTALKETPHSAVPVIVTTGNGEKENEKQAFNLGAWDFVSKPYDAQILTYRVQSAIARSESAAFEKMKYMSEHDELTGLYSPNKFFEKTQTMLQEHTELDFAFVRFDIDRFSLVNTFFGNAQGDEVLKYIATHLERFAKQNFAQITYGRIEADEFAFCCNYSDLSALQDLIKQTTLELKQYQLSFEIVLTSGIYLISDRSISPRQMLDNANMAAKRVKGYYSNNISIYDDEMGRILMAEQEIINNMNQALKEEQFCIYVQPKYDLRTNLPAGAEALVRWIHPERGMISPGEFIPVFEKNGFIAKLDYYVWEKACCLLEELEKNNLERLPISVNVSRVHLYNPHLTEILCEIADRHKVPHELLNLELTESIYTEHSGVIQESISNLHQNGFLVMMDDFGSGYSSLNVLKDVEFDVLKIDMSFFKDSSIQGRKEKIIASVIRMAKWLALPTIAEGVETKEQVDFLSGLGCEYVQGYYFARPMPTEDYKLLLSSIGNPGAKEEKKVFADNIWKNNDQIELMFAVMPKPLVVFEFGDKKVELLRVNQHYYDLFGYNNFSDNSFNFETVLSEEQKAVVWSAVYRAIESGGVSECDYQRAYPDGSSRVIHTYLRYVKQLGSRHILLGIFSDITSEVQVKQELEQCKGKMAELEAERNYALKLSRRDSLTEVYNRATAENLIRQYLSTCPQGTHGFMILDLDNFKVINDTYGHMCGDEVLKKICEIFCAFFKSTDIIGRLGGDEFFIFMPKVRDEQLLQQKAVEICEELSQHKFTDLEISISITIGACISDTDSTFEDLYRRSDKALYEAKQAGKMQVKLYHEKRSEVSL